MQNIDENLREMFINLSTNRDLRRILEYYDEHGLRRENLTHDFYHLMEQLTTEEIADRISIDLYVDFENINIVNGTLDYCLCENPNLKDVQIDYIARRTSLDLIAIENLINIGNMTSDTLNLVIHNSSSKDIYEICFENTKYLLDKESAFKLMNLADAYHKDFYVWIAANVKGLTEEEIDNIFESMEIGGMEMEHVVGEGLLSQANLTDKQLEKIAFWDEYPSPMVFETCWKKNCYSEEDVFKFYKNGDEQISKIIFNSGNVPLNIINDAYLSNDEDKRMQVMMYSNADKNYQRNLLLLEANSLEPTEEKMLVEAVKKDARLFLSVAMCEHKAVLKAAYEAIDDFFSNTGFSHIYEQRRNIIRTLAYNKNIGNDMIFRIINENSDAFNEDERLDLHDKAIMSMNSEEEKNIENFLDEQKESLDDYLANEYAQSHKTYNDQYYEDNWEDR